VQSSAAPLVVALDGMAEPDALALARLLRGKVWGFKVNDLLLRTGTAIVPRLRQYGRVFCDPKLHDIPNTVSHQVSALGDAGADLITVHASGGAAMLRAARAACRGPARLLGVTVLTAMPDAEVARVYGRPTEALAEELMRLTLESGLDGLVCSPRELDLADRVDPERSLLRATPGVRPAWSAARAMTDDQRRVLAPREALRRGASLLVVGRPITSADDPLAATERILAELASTD
jgi:orotidine-5'-phosphate decarboxylase